MYWITGLAITVGLHRMLAHRALESGPVTRGVLAAIASMSMQGQVLNWVANHRKHHHFSDEPGDPHSPHLSSHGGLRGALEGLWHAHMGWFITGERASHVRYVPDLLADPVIRFVDRTFALWVLVGLAIPFLAGLAIGGTMDAALLALLWGGAVRIFALQHVTFSINSLCHFLGRRRFRTGDHARNLAPLAPISFGEAWHNNHHAFPTSAFHGLRRWEVDPGGLLVSVLERLGLVWNVNRPSAERQQSKLLVESEPAATPL